MPAAATPLQAFLYAGQFGVLDETRFFSAQINRPIDRLIHLEARRQGLCQLSFLFGGEVMLQASAAFWSHVQVVSLALPIGITECHKRELTLSLLPLRG